MAKTANKSEKIAVPRDVNPRYLSMGMWKSRILEKKGKASRTTSSVARSYIAIPPPEGWTGGDPRKNGLGAAGKK